MMLLYGEDAFTIMMLGPDRALFLKALGDTTDPGKAAVFIRPSFGRKGTIDPAHPRPEFGEFDAIVATGDGIYLIETKWSHSSGTNRHQIVLEPVQVKRHAVMRAYIDAWRGSKPEKWAKVAEIDSLATSLRNHGCCVPKAGSKQARNLRIVLGIVTRACDGPIRDILLFIRTEDKPPPTEADAKGFELVCADYRNSALRGFVVWPDGNSRSGPAVSWSRSK